MNHKPVRFEDLNHLERTAECFRHTVLSFESWISPEGNIRAWLRINCLVFAWLVIPAVLILPVVKFILWQITTKLVLFLLALGVFRKFKR